MIILHLAAHELRRLFQAPFAWIVLAVVQFLIALFFFILLTRYMDPGGSAGDRGLTEVVVAGTLQIAGIVLLLVAPFLTMRLFSEERQQGTIALLYSAPLSLTELVIGKYLGILAFLGAVLLLIALLPLSLLAGTPLDPGQLAAGFLGLALLLTVVAAAGMFVSTLTEQPALAAIGSFALLFLLWIIHVAAYGSGERAAAVFRYLSLLRHYENLLSGYFSTADVVYFLLLAACFVVLSIWRLDGLRTHY